LREGAAATAAPRQELAQLRAVEATTAAVGPQVAAKKKKTGWAPRRQQAEMAAPQLRQQAVEAQVQAAPPAVAQECPCRYSTPPRKRMKVRKQRMDGKYSKFYMAHEFLEFITKNERIQLNRFNQKV